jgi:hypothetical protein
VDILSHLSSSLFVAEQKLVVPLISAVKAHPVTSRMISIFLSLCTGVGDADLRRSGNKEHRCFISRTFVVGVDVVDKCWYLSKINNLIIFVKGAQRFFLPHCIRKGGDFRQQVVSLHPHSI